MLETKTPGLTRRGFLKTTGVVAGAAAVGGIVNPTLQALAEEDVKQSSEEQVHICGCQHSCSMCLAEVVTRDGRVVQTRTWPKNPLKERPCAKGRAQIQSHYNTGRLKYPMRRVGERGSGEWERITWDEAIATIADNLKRIMKEYGSEAVGIISSGGASNALVNATVPGGLLNTRLMNALGWTSIAQCTDDALCYGMQKALGGGFYRWAGSQSAPTTKTYIRWSSNVGPSFPGNWKGLADAKKAGAKLVVVDSTFTFVASKADLWIRPRPGSDPALMLSLIQVIVEEGLANEKFLLANTVAPVLIRQDNKRFVRMSDVNGTKRSPLDDRAENMGGGYNVVPEVNPVDDKSDDPPAVWDTAAGKPGEFGVVAAPALTGDFEVNGIPCKTAYDMLVESVQPYTPEAAAKLCDIDPEIIRELAHICADVPVMHGAGYGSQAYNNGVQIGHALATLCAVTGNLGIPGGGATGMSSYEVNREAYNTGHEWKRAIPRVALYDVMATGKYGDKDLVLKALYIDGCGCMVGGATDLNRTKKELLDPMEFIFAVDIAFTDVALYCDIVLPAAGSYEKEDVAIYGGICLKYFEKVVDPPFECKPDGEVYRLLADAMGVGSYFEKTNDELVEQLLDHPWMKSAGASLAAVKEKHVVFLPSLFKPPLCSKGIYETPTGKMEFYVDYPVPRINYGQDYDFDGEHLPRFFPPTEAWPGTPEMEKYPFVLMSTRVHQRFHVQMFNCQWLLETDPEPSVRINPSDAKERNISDGDYVEVFNDRGHAVAVARYSEAIKPGCLVYPKGWCGTQHKAGHWSELTFSKFDPVGLNNSYFDTAADIRLWNGEV
ncbi:MAG: molybdopterin-dependent oxidoreductase [Raoultibacter sp.]